MHTSIHYCWGISVTLLLLGATKSFLRDHIPRNKLLLQTALSNEVWWQDGLKFGCTGCGKCCKNDGEVWFDIDEFSDLCRHLKLTHEDVIEKYGDIIKGSYIKMKNKISTANDQCIFLGDDGKTCTVYEVRPVQCRTYPWWPSLLENRSDWDNEAVVEDHLQGKHWSPQTGGCEGIEHPDASNVQSTVIYRNNEFYSLYLDFFPFMTYVDDKSRFVEKLGMIKSIVKSTSFWVKDFVVKYDLCPFAEKVFADQSIRYRVFFGSDEEQIKKKLRYEILALLTAKEEEVSTTLLILPFVSPNFEDFYELSLRLEDDALPLIEDSIKGPKTLEMQQSQGKRRSLLRRAKSVQDKSQSPAATSSGADADSGCPVEGRLTSTDSDSPAIQLAFFHPSFQWADCDFQSSVNYEKRSPFPTINLLRAARIREFANQEKSKKISSSNLNALEAAGPLKLQNEFESIVRLALE